MGDNKIEYFLFEVESTDFQALFNVEGDDLNAIIKALELKILRTSFRDFLESKDFILLSFSPCNLSKFYSDTILNPSDKIRLLSHKNLSENLSFRSSRVLNFINLKTFAKIFRWDLCNLSHSKSHKKSVVLEAFSSRKMALDLEIILPRDNEYIIDFAFSAFEKSLLEDAKNKLLKFYEIWTLKEALIKFFNFDLGYINAVGLGENGIFAEHIDSMYLSGLKFSYKIFHTNSNGDNSDAICCIVY